MMGAQPDHSYLLLRLFNPAPLYLLGNGLDAIIQHTRVRGGRDFLDFLIAPRGREVKDPLAPTDSDRRMRYHDALHWHARPDHNRREAIGVMALAGLRRHWGCDAAPQNVIQLSTRRGIRHATKGVQP